MSWADIVKKEPITDLVVSESSIKVLGVQVPHANVQANIQGPVKEDIKGPQENTQGPVKEEKENIEDLGSKELTFFRHGDQHTKKISKRNVCVFIANQDSQKFLLLTDFGKYHWNKGTDIVVPFSGTYAQWCKHLEIKRGRCIGIHKISRFCGENVTIMGPESG